MSYRAAHCALAGVLAGGLLASCGCACWEYLSRQALGQLGVLARSVAIGAALESGTLPSGQRRKLRLIVQAREFARRELGLHVGWAYALFDDTGGAPVAYNLSAAPKDSLSPKRWSFPVIGQIDYVGYFSRADAERAAAELQRQGYDTLLRPVDAYSTLGWLPDPVHSPLLSRDEPELVETVIHELAHNTVYASGHSDFNETLATFIGRRGTLLFYQRRGAAGAGVVEALRRRYADRDRITAWLAGLFEALREYYARDMSYRQKVAGREAVFQAARERFEQEVRPRLNEPQRLAAWGRVPTNNAWLLLNRRYNLDLELLADVYARSGGDFPAFVRTLRAAARSADPWAYLRRPGD